MQECRVILVDDHALFREALARGLHERSSGIRVTGQAGSSTEASALLAQSAFDVLILDLTIPGRGGADVMALARKRYPNLAILILSAHPPDQYIASLVQDGAAGYLHKSCSLEELIDAVRRIHQGKRVIDDQLADIIQHQSRLGEDTLPHETLSHRERQVMEMLVAGDSISDISREMTLSIKTTSTYRKRILQKLSVGSNSEMVRYAMRHALTDQFQPETDQRGEQISQLLHRVSNDLTTLRLNAELLEGMLQDDRTIPTSELRDRVAVISSVASSVEAKLKQLKIQRS